MLPTVSLVRWCGQPFNVTWGQLRSTATNDEVVIQMVDFDRGVQIAEFSNSSLHRRDARATITLPSPLPTEWLGSKFDNAGSAIPVYFRVVTKAGNESSDCESSECVRRRFKTIVKCCPLSATCGCRDCSCADGGTCSTMGNTCNFAQVCRRPCMSGELDECKSMRDDCVTRLKINRTVVAECQCNVQYIACLEKTACLTDAEKNATMAECAFDKLRCNPQVPAVMDCVPPCTSVDYAARSVCSVDESLSFKDLMTAAALGVKTETTVKLCDVFRAFQVCKYGVYSNYPTCIGEFTETRMRECTPDLKMKLATINCDYCDEFVNTTSSPFNSTSQPSMASIDGSFSFTTFFVAAIWWWAVAKQ